MPRSPGVTHEIPDDQEIAGESHSANDAEFVFEPLASFGWRILPVSLAKSLLAEFSQVVLRLDLRPGGVNNRKMTLAEIQVDIHTVGDFLRPTNRVFVSPNNAYISCGART
ncbi:MAG: hypothetical protein KatS3mg105_3904 [Gemmatales bacterium]|nr:MAG: hypothetical protein KatS3mg105_3904 [Gemmatales bacterium]